MPMQRIVPPPAANHWLLPLIIPFLLILGCEDEQIRWKTEHVDRMLVVEGSLTNEKKVHRIRLSTSADYFDNKETPRVSGAQVTVTSQLDTFRFEELPDQEGVYTTTSEVAGKTGQTYRLDIHLPEPIRGQTHYHASETMIKGIDLDAIEAYLYENPIYVEESPMDSLILYVTAYGEEPSGIRNYYAVNLFRNNKALKDTIDEVDIYSDTEELEGDYINYLFFFEHFQPGDTVGLELATVSKAYRKYVTGLKNIVNQSGNPFDMSGPPANAIGNMEGGESLGFFRVSYVSKARSVVQDRREQMIKKKQSKEKNRRSP